MLLVLGMMLLGFMLGVICGMLFTVLMQINIPMKNYEELHDKLMENYCEGDDKSFTYDCLNDPDPDEDIPKIN